jgi:hypothetical protein
MSKKSSEQFRIASLLKKGKPFVVLTEKERKIVLSAAKFIGVNVTTRSRTPEVGFDVRYL